MDAGGLYMTEVKYFHIQGCPYCAQADKAIKELQEEDRRYEAVKFDRVDEMEHPEIADQYDYQATPAMFLNHEKVYESHLGETYDEAKAHVREVLEAALRG